MSQILTEGIYNRDGCPVGRLKVRDFLKVGDFKNSGKMYR